MKSFEICPGCGSKTEKSDGSVHEYMTSSPGCWSSFTEVLEKEYSNPDYMKVHRLTVDTYACQHIGDGSSQAIQSVNVHLAALYWAIEKNMNYSKIPQYIEKLILSNKAQFRLLSAPSFQDTLKAIDIAKASSSEEHCQIVKLWAEQVWNAWGVQHSYVRAMAESIF